MIPEQNSPEEAYDVTADSPQLDPLGLPAATEPPASVGNLVRNASEQISTLIRAEIELAKTELTGSVKRGGIGAGLIAAAGGVLLLSVPFLFVVLAEVLIAVGLPRWAGYLIVWGVFLLIAAVLALLGVRSLRRIRKPERTMETVRDTATWARHPTRSDGQSDGQSDGHASGQLDGRSDGGSSGQPADTSDSRSGGGSAGGAGG